MDSSMTVTPPDRQAGPDPSFWRGLTQPRLSQQGMSRRQLLRSAGAGAGALGIGAFLAACGVKGATTATSGSTPAGGVGTAAWWAKQKLHHTVNFANWPYYIDVLKGKHLSLEHFTQPTGIQVNYTEPISDNTPFYAKIRPSLQAKQSTGYDIIVMTNNSPPLGYLIELRLADPAGPQHDDQLRQVRGPADQEPVLGPGQQVHDGLAVRLDRDRLQLLGRQGPRHQRGHPVRQEVLGQDRHDVRPAGTRQRRACWPSGSSPATSKESDWAKAAKKLQQQKSDGLVRAYYDQSYIDHLKNGDIVVSQAWSGDIFQADLNSKYRDLKLMIPTEGGMFWTDNMCIPMYAQNPKDAMTLMDFYYDPQVQAVVEYYDDYICPVPGRQEVLLNPTGWAKTALAEMKPEIGLPTSTTANAPTVFPTAQYIKNSRNYYQYKSQEELTAWNNLFLPITQGA